MKTYNRNFCLKLFFGSIVSAIILTACSDPDQVLFEGVSISDSAVRAKSFSTAAVFKKLPDRQFIRTADLKFKVKNVINTTSVIEKVTNDNGGFVTSTELSTKVSGVSIIVISEDSSLESTEYQVINQMVLRIPNSKLDSALREISRAVEHLDHRIIKAEDVALQILSNDLTQRRLTTNAGWVEYGIDHRGRKLRESTLAEDVLLQRQQQADAAGLANLSLSDQVSFSTVNLSLYERPAIKRELVGNNKNISVYEPSFGKKLLASFTTGWKVLEAILVFIAKLWTLILLALIVVFVVRLTKFRTQFKN